MTPPRSTAAGGIQFVAIAEADWQASGGGLSGDWGQAAHWSTGAVPDATVPAVISDTATATAAWLVTATNEAAASLLLDMTLGTLEVAGGLAVSGTLSQTLGTLLLDAGATLSAAEVTQTGGAILLNDAGGNNTALVSAGTDAVNGAVTLLNGARWADAALGIGVGVVGGPAVSATVTLEGTAGAATLRVAGAAQIGGDPTAQSPGGTGALVVDGGGAAAFGALSVLAGSSVAVDAASFVTVGADATAQAGAIAIGATSELFCDISTLQADVVNAGTLAIDVYLDGAGTTPATQPGNVLVTGSLANSGTVTIAATSTLTVQGSIELDAGSLSVASGGTVSAGTSASAGVDLLGGQMTLDGAALHSLGTADIANSNATLAAGADWSTASLFIGVGYSDGTTADATVALSGASTLAVAGFLGIGQDPGIGAAASTDPGGIGTLSVLGGGVATASGLALANGGALVLDATGAVLLGTPGAVAGAVTAGAVAVGAGATLAADIAGITGNLVNAGLVQVGNWAGGALTATGNVVVTGAASGGAGGAITIAAGATLELGGAQALANSIDISAGGLLILDAGDMPGAIVQADGGVVTIDVRGITYDPAGFTTAVAPGNATDITFANATQTGTLGILAPGQTLADISFADDGHGGTFVIDAPCYAAGTRIATASGETPVEALRPGDLLRTADGRLVPVRWVGRRRIDFSRHPRPWRVAPVRVAAGAIAPGVPARDLFVSPDHALCVGGALVPAGRLANGASIARQDGFPAVTYLHIECERHEILLAEGCPAESFLDTGNRALFANAPGAAALHPDLSDTPDPAALAIWAALGAAPLLLGGAALDAVRASLLARAAALGWRSVPATRPVLLADGVALALRAVGQGAWRAGLHPSIRRLHLRSAAFIPAEMDPVSGDMRRLGLAVRALLLDGVALPDAAYGAGWHAAEDGFRWTDGAADMLLPARGRRAVLEIATAPSGPYWMTRAMPVAARA